MTLVATTLPIGGASCIWYTVARVKESRTWNGLRESVVSFLMSGVMYYVWTIWSSGEDPEVVCLSSSAHNISIEQLSVEACGYLACLSSLILSTPCLSALLDSHQSVPLLYKYCYVTIASYPGLLTPAFVACGTNAGEGLVKLSHVV